MSTETQRRQLLVVWALMFGALPVYGFACYVIFASQPPAAEVSETLRYALTLAAFATGACGLAWWRFRLPIDAGGAAVSFADVTRDCVIVWALCESVALFGMIAAFLAIDFYRFVPFGVAAAALFVMHRPDRLAWNRVRESRSVG